MAVLQQLHGTILRVRDFGDAHRIVEALTAEAGRVSAVARNARGSKRRFAGLDLFAEAKLMLQEKRGDLWYLQEAVVTRPRAGIRSDLQLIGRAARLCEVVRLLVAEHAPAPASFSALGQALDRLDAGDLSGAAELYPRLLTAAGIMPDFAVCLRCGTRALGAARLDGEAGGVLCGHCSPGLGLLSADVVAGFLGAPCTSEQVAASLEASAVKWIEGQTGRSVGTASWL